MTGPRDGIVPPTPARFRVAGHSRIIVPVGRSTPRQPTPGGWDMSCTCGLPVRNYPRRADAAQAYREHRTAALPVCNVCGEAKPATCMTKSSRGLCKACSLDKSNRWRLHHAESAYEHSRRHWLMKKYGLTPEAYDALLLEQGGVCGICRRPPLDPRGFKMHVDHDHESGRVRGILCGPCNQGIGQLGDTLERLELAVAYLRKAAVEEARCAS